MRRFYRPGSRIEAYLLRDLLRHAGIATYVFNENAQSAVGAQFHDDSREEHRSSGGGCDVAGIRACR